VSTARDSREEELLGAAEALDTQHKLKSTSEDLLSLLEADTLVHSWLQTVGHSPSAS
jgi:hypothetical protein